MRVPGSVLGDEEAHLANVEKTQDAEKNEKNEKDFHVCAHKELDLEPPQRVESAEEIRQSEGCWDEKEEGRNKKSNSENPFTKPGGRARTGTSWGFWGHLRGQLGCHV